MASYYFSPIGNSQQLSTTGAPLNAGTITTFQAGTSTPQATYTDNAGSNPATSLTLNTYGLPSSPVWLLGGQTYKFLIKDSLGNLIRTIDNVSGINDFSTIPLTNDLRLTLTSGTPVTSTDVSSAGTVYACPYTGNRIALMVGGVWQVFVTAQFSLALSLLTSGKPYDVFAYANGASPAMEFLVWTNDTTRATALAYQDGVLVKSGDVTRRYLGTFYTTGVATTEDSEAKRYLWNYYHRVARSMKVLSPTSSWSYSIATYRQANADTGNQLNYVVGVSEDAVSASAFSLALNSTATQRNMVTAVGVDSTTVASGLLGYCAAASTAVRGVATYEGLPGVGRHFLVWLEKADGADTQTWFGGPNAYYQNGIIGQVFA